jgi:2-polyprenyl-3-methyl-5-hydroxy-6-metoxy-1,4-benzoquinol methylase
MDVVEFFDRAYSEADRYWWKEPHRYSADPLDHAASLLTQQLMRVVRSQAPGRVLDLGGGEGADAIRLALLGWDALLVESSLVACEKAAEFASESGVQIEVINDSIITFPDLGEFDLVICNGVLHYVEDKSSAIRRIQGATRPGGMNVISSWTTYTEVPAAHTVVPCFPDEERGSIWGSYESWEPIIWYLERAKMETSHDDFEPHVHSFIKLIARNTQGAHSS